MKLPSIIYNLIKERGHLRNIEKLFKRDYPQKLEKLKRKFPNKKFGEVIYLVLKKPVQLCLICNSSTPFVNFIKGYKPYCSRKCMWADENLSKEKQRKVREKWGGVHYMMNPKVRRKFNKTMLKRHGVEWALQSEEVHEKSSKTLMRKYGVKRATELPQWLIGVKSDKAKQRRAETWQRTLGVSNPQQNREIFEKGQNKRLNRKIIKIKGKQFSYQGFEGIVLQYLLKKFKPSQIINTVTDGCPTIDYKFRGKNHRYHPDILVIKDEKSILIEVKSTFTLGARQKDVTIFRKNMAKFRQASKNHIIWLAVVGAKTNEIIWIKNPHLKNKSYIIETTKHLR